MLTVSTAIRSPGNQADLTNDPKVLAAKARKATITLRATSSDLSKAQLDPVFGRDQAALDVAEYLVGPNSAECPVGWSGRSGQDSHRASIGAHAGSKPKKNEAPQVGSGSDASSSGRFKFGGALRSQDLVHHWIAPGLRYVGLWHVARAMSETYSRSACYQGDPARWFDHRIDGSGQDRRPAWCGFDDSSGGFARTPGHIGECTPEQITIIERDEPLLLRALVRYDVSEPSTDEVTKILQLAAEHRTQPRLRRPQPKTQFSQSALEELNRLHRRYASYSALPAQPLRLMQTILERSPAGTSIESADVARAFAAQTGLPTFLVDDSVVIDLEHIRGRLSAH